jgi:hypothetical protein
LDGVEWIDELPDVLADDAGVHHYLVAHIKRTLAEPPIFRQIPPPSRIRTLSDPYRKKVPKITEDTVPIVGIIPRLGVGGHHGLENAAGDAEETGPGILHRLQIVLIGLR